VAGHRAGEDGRKRVRACGARGAAGPQLVLGGLGVFLLIVGVVVALHGSPATSDTAARANLANSLVDARAAYDLSQSYSFDGSPLSTLSFDSQDPAFSWTTGSCAGRPANCVSEQVVDVHSPGDSQGVVLATFSSATDTCWYAADLESVPEPLPGDHAGSAFDPGTAGGSRSGRDSIAEGIYYSRSKPGASVCSAGAALARGGTWSRAPSR